MIESMASRTVLTRLAASTRSRMEDVEDTDDELVAAAIYRRANDMDEETG
jgi:hypothetical protein